MVTLEQRYKKDPDVIARRVLGEMVLAPVRHDAGDAENVYVLNDTAEYAWELIDGERTLGQILDAIVAEFEVEKEQAEGDLLELFTQLEEIQAVVPA